MRIYLTGQLAVEDRHGGLVDLRGLPGRQGRRGFVYLVLASTRPVTHVELAEAIWDTDLPDDWQGALSAIVSKIRRALAQADDGGATISGDFGTYQIRLPVDVWVDIEVAVASIEQAERALKRGEWQAAWAPAAVAHTITERPFLPAESGAWCSAQRSRLDHMHLRALDCLTEVWLISEQYPLAVQTANRAVMRAPLREAGYLNLMRAHAATSNRGEALRAYDLCRRRLSDELGVDPSPRTEALYLELLGN